MQKKFAEIQTALAQVDIAKGVVKDSSQKIRKETDETSDSIKHYADSLRGVKEQLKSVTDRNRYDVGGSEKLGFRGKRCKTVCGLKAQLKVAADEMRSFARRAGEYSKSLKGG